MEAHLPYLTLSLFGSPQIRLNGVTVEIAIQKAVALLVYLALTRVPHRRDILASLFWPDYEQASARTYLRQALYELTKTLGHDWFDVSREEVGLAQRLSIQTDVHEFRTLTNLGADDINADALRQAIALYKGDFLAGFSLPDCPEFDQWQLLETENLRHILVETLQALMRWQIDRQEYAAAIELGRRWLAIDPYHEAAYRFLMQLYAWTGQQTAALRLYEECKRLLLNSLQIGPDPETQALYDAIRNRRLPSPPSRVPKEEKRMAQASPPPSAPASRLAAVAAPSFLSTQVASTQAAATNAAPFVARQRELNELAGALSSACQASGQILFVIGGAGRGKTTLVQEFARRAQGEYADLLVVSGTCNAYTGSGDPYLPFREILLALTGDVETKWAGGLLSTENARRLWQAMPTNVPALVDLAPDLLRTFVPMKPLQARAENFAAPHGEWVQQLRLLAAEEQRLPLEERQLFAQFTDAFKAIAAQHPLLLILEDLHWVDAASNNLLFHLSRMLGQSRLLVIGTYRPNELMVSRQPDDRHPLASIVGELKRQHGDIWLDLGRLSPAEGQAFVDAYLDTQPNRLDEGFRAALFRHTQGHALFTVELLREMQERGDVERDGEGYWTTGKSTSWSVLPAKVEGVIEQRINRLQQGLQEMLAVASIEGESFTAEVVARAHGQAEYDVVQRLSQELDRQHRLVRVESLESVGPQRLSRYRFRHHLFQRYIYNRLTESERAYLHEKVGYAMENLYAEQTALIAVQLAHHFEQAGLAEKAVAYLRQAGEQAYHISANQEAIELLTRALALLTALQSTQRRSEQELALRITLGRVLQHTKGLGSEEARDVFLRAYELCAQVGNDHDRFAALHGLHSTSRDYKRVLAIAEQMLQIADNQPNPIYLVSAHHLMGHNLMISGDYISARAHLEQSIALYEPRHHHDYVLLCGQDEGVAALANLSWALWHLGYPGQALQRGQEAVALAEELSHPMSVAIAQHFVVWIHLLRGEAQIAHQKIDALLELASEQGFGFVLAVANTYRGQALLLEGQVDAAIEQLEQARESWRRMKLTWYEPYVLLELVVAHCRKGQFERGFVLLNKAEVTIEALHEFFEQDVLYQIKGELLLAQSMIPVVDSIDIDRTLQMDEAEAAFMQSLQVARMYQAKSRELQATIGLCRLWKHQGKSEAAHSALAEIYDLVHRGF